jgi:hypothetical protein
MQTTPTMFEFIATEVPHHPAPRAGLPGLWATHAIRASDLHGKAFAPLRYVLPGFIPEGATLLVSRPKLGKSWLMLDLCIAIAADRPALATLQPAAGDVLYLALEDSERRLQRRMATLLPNANAWPSRLTLATRWRRANDGGLDDIRDWCKWVEKPTAVVVDTLDKFRSFGGAGQPYHDSVVQLQKLANEYGMAVIIVHHRRKTNADDPFDSISGTAGLAGTADTILMMRKVERGAVLHVRGRDVEDSDTLLAFNRESCRWSICGPASAPVSNERAAVLAILDQADGPMPVGDIMHATGSTRSAMDSLLSRMVAAGEIVRIASGHYACKTSKTARSGGHEIDPQRELQES